MHINLSVQSNVKIQIRVSSELQPIPTDYCIEGGVHPGRVASQLQELKILKKKSKQFFLITNHPLICQEVKCIHGTPNRKLGNCQTIWRKIKLLSELHTDHLGGGPFGPAVKYLNDDKWLLRNIDPMLSSVVRMDHLLFNDARSQLMCSSKDDQCSLFPCYTFKKCLYGCQGVSDCRMRGVSR